MSDGCRFGGDPWPFIVLGCLIPIGIYLISNGVDAGFKRAPIVIGWVCGVAGSIGLGLGIIHGDLVPRFLAVCSATENTPAFSQDFCASARCYGRTENVRVLAVVVAPAELGDVKRQIFGADMVEAAHDAALGKRKGKAR